MTTHATRLAIAALLVSAALVEGCGKRNPRGTGAPVQTAFVPVTNMVFVKAGSFTRLNQQIVLSRDYWLGKYEVTQAEFSALTGRNPSQFPGDSNRPVEKVSFVDAATYCASLTRQQRDAGRIPPGYEYRLPTEAEWEYACRAGASTQFSFGDNPDAGGDYAWTEENSDGTTHPVGQKTPNVWGFHDLHGNVWEWCQDWFAEYPKENLTDPVGPASSKFKVFRGGGWNAAAKFARVNSRFMMPPSNAIHFVGFRVALGPVLSKPK